MGNLINKIFLTGIIGARSLVGLNGYGQTKDNFLKNFPQLKAEDLDSTKITLLNEEGMLKKPHTIFQTLYYSNGREIGLGYDNSCRAVGEVVFVKYENSIEEFNGKEGKELKKYLRTLSKKFRGFPSGIYTGFPTAKK